MTISSKLEATNTQGPPSNAHRIAVLRQRCLDRKQQIAQSRPGLYDRLVSCLWNPMLDERVLRQSENVQPWSLRRAMLCRERLRQAPLEMNELELLAGRWVPTILPVNDETYVQAIKHRKQFQFDTGLTGHCELDLTRLFAIGLDALGGEVSALAKQASDLERKQTYESFLVALEGLAGLIQNAAASARTAAAGAPAWRKAELEWLAQDIDFIAHRPPETFRQAVQLMWLVELGVMLDNVALVVPGRLDRTLLPYYRRDIASGRLTPDAALLLLESFYLLINEYVCDGLTMSVMVGGADAGNDVTNELSYLCLEALRRTRLILPTVGVCWNPKTPQNLMDLAVDLVASGLPTPAFFNDAVIQKGLADLGVPRAELSNYINSTCVEITPVGGSGVWVASPYFNLTGVLLEEIAAQAIAPQAAANFEEFLAAYQQRMSAVIAKAVAEQNKMRLLRASHEGKPLQSVFTRDCMGRGKDIDRGGALYNWLEVSFVGLANLADSLVVLSREVFDGQAKMTLAQLKAVLDSDFVGQDVLRRRFAEAHPKYGNNAPQADQLVQRMSQFLAEECRRHSIEPDASPVVPGFFCWIQHEELGRVTGATPDGRKAGFPFADGCGPAQGREVNGPTAGVLSTTCWDHTPMIGGLAYNMKFSAQLLKSPNARQGLRDLIITFLQRGGFETQINVVDRETLLAARKDPEQYRDLAVRIGGYVDYFIRLSPQMQDEVLLRSEHKGTT